jgi:hypothetical protein
MAPSPTPYTVAYHAKLPLAALTKWSVQRYLRGAEVIEVRDIEGQLFNDFRGRVKPEDAHKLRRGTKRTLLLALDTAQHQTVVAAVDLPCSTLSLTILSHPGTCAALR